MQNERCRKYVNSQDLGTSGQETVILLSFFKHLGYKIKMTILDGSVATFYKGILKQSESKSKSKQTVETK